MRANKPLAAAAEPADAGRRHREQPAIRGRWARLGHGVARSLAVHDPRRPVGPDDLFPEEGAHTAPRIARFLAADSSPRIGLVVASTRGVPHQFLDLTARHGIGPGLLEFAAAGGFELAERELERYEPEGDGPDRVTISPAELPRRLLSPVDINLAHLESGARLVVGFGLTFRSHRAETRGPRPFVFPKPVPPTGAYAPVIAGKPCTMLLDYELELGCVALRDIDLDRLEEIDPATHFAYLSVNDVSAREPLVRDRRAGYVRAKARPTYLPAGPWLLPGAHFTRDDPALRRMVLTVEEAEPRSDGGEARGSHSLRQDARLEDLTLGLRELLDLLARHRRLTMQGRDGRSCAISVRRGGRWLLPAGSLLLTGTPGGTAIRAPDSRDRLSLLLRAIRHLHWPSEGYRRHLETHRHAFGFLSPGDRVSGWITGLGRQEWEVR